MMNIHGNVLLNRDIVFDDVAVNPFTAKGFPIDE